jgi:hypothetical protein
MPLNLVKTSKGNDAVLHNGYKFRKDRELNSGEISWRCIKKTCRSTIKTSSALLITRDSTNPHNHSLLDCRQNVSFSSVASSSPASDTGPCMEATVDLNLSRISSMQRKPEENQCVSCSTPNSMHCSVNVPTYEELKSENETLKEKIVTLREQWSAMVDRSIDLDRRLLELEEYRGVDVSCQTEDFCAPSEIESSLHLEPRILVNPLFTRILGSPPVSVSAT